MAKLIVRYPNNEIKEIEFEKTIYKIGRAPDNDLVLDNNEVDDHQAVIETSNGVFTLVDKSENKSTKVNGKQVERVNITYGDRISFGPIVALFYPSKKSGGISDRLKVILYISAGAIIIIASIILIFLLITPRISSSITKSIGGTYLESKGRVIAEKTTKKEVGKVKKGVQKGKKIIVESGGAGEKTIIKRERKTPLQNFFSVFRPKFKVALPEPTEKEISNRKAIAIPHGIKRLFFRKILVYVEVPVKNKGEGEIQKEVKKWEKEKAGLETQKIPKIEKGMTTQKLPIKGQPETKQLENVQNRGILKTITSPFRNIYISIFKKKAPTTTEVTAPATQNKTSLPAEVLETTGIKTVETTIKTKNEKRPIKIPSKETLKAIINPLEEINKIELTQVKSRLPEETPIYSADELKRINKENLFKNIALSDKENVNADVLWKYPSSIGVKSPGEIIYGGSVGFVNNDKFPDYVFTTKDGKLISIDGKNGEEILNLDLKASLYGPVITRIKGKNSNVLLIYKNGKIESYTTTLEKKWFAVEDHPITALPVLTDINGDGIDDVIIPTLGMEIVAIDGKSGFEIWRFSDLTGDVDTAPVALDVNGDSISDIIVNSVDGYINVIDGKTGWGLWKRKIYGRPAGPPLVADLDGDGKDEIISLTRNGILTSYSLKGKNLFTISLGKNFIIPPSAGDIDNNGTVDLVFMSTDGIVQAIEGKTRRILWKYDTGEKTSFGRIALADMNMDKYLDVVFTTSSGLVYVLDGKSGTPLSIFNTGDFVLSTPTIYDFNRDKIPEIVVPTYGGSVYCFNISGTKKPFLYLAKSCWPSENHDIRNSGVSELESRLIF